MAALIARDFVLKSLQFGLLMIASWVVMTTTHELGHIFAGWLGGGTLVQFELRPWKLPHSLFSPDPRPLLTVWSGPILGVLLPVSVAAIVKHPAVWFVANFCLIANGSYLAAAWLSGDRLLDTQRLLDAGAPPWSIAAYIGLTCGVGYIRFRSSCVAFFGSTSNVVS